ncbi:DUF4199 domain-containing protein [Ekhidna sp.]|uniref:DUF4199 domain-containing protein n=1 Tax=Ekhidna sp. TaxID=2608089 RepID=UPI003CCBC28D
MKTLEKHILRYGVMTTIGLIAFFLVMKLFGLTQITELRALNAIIMFSGAYLAIKKFRDEEFNYSFNYLMGIGTGFAVGMITSILFSVFVMSYLFLDPAFTQSIIESHSNNAFLNELTLSMVIFIEAMGSAFIFSLISMQYLKQDVSITKSKASEA